MYALNAPLESGITDEAYRRLFQPVMRKAVEVFQPEAIVFQSGVWHSYSLTLQLHPSESSSEF